VRVRSRQISGSASRWRPHIRLRSRGVKNSVTNLTGYSKLSTLPIDCITSEIIAAFIAHRQCDEVQIATVNRDLAMLRRIFHLATEWGKVNRVLPRVRLLPGENHRERVLSFEEEAAYLDAAAASARASESRESWRCGRADQLRMGSFQLPRAAVTSRRRASKSATLQRSTSPKFSRSSCRRYATHA